jgi:hypothetical protein
MTNGQRKQRQARRFACDCEARCEILGKQSIGRITTLSATGAWIERSDPPAEGSILKLSFAAGSVDIATQARVVDRLPGKGMGVAFQDLLPQYRKAIEALSADATRN